MCTTKIPFIEFHLFLLIPSVSWIVNHDTCIFSLLSIGTRPNHNAQDAVLGVLSVKPSISKPFT